MVFVSHEKLANLGNMNRLNFAQVSSVIAVQILQDMRISWQWSFKLWSSGLWCCVVMC